MEIEGLAQVRMLHWLTISQLLINLLRVFWARQIELYHYEVINYKVFRSLSTPVGRYVKAKVRKQWLDKVFQSSTWWCRLRFRRNTLALLYYHPFFANVVIFLQSALNWAKILSLRRRQPFVMGQKALARNLRREEKCLSAGDKGIYKVALVFTTTAPKCRTEAFRRYKSSHLILPWTCATE